MRIGATAALDEIAEKLSHVAREFGPEAILPFSYAGTMGLLNNCTMDRRFFHRLGASRLDRTICSTAGGAGLNQSLGYRYGTEPEQYPQSKLILAWGANILGTNVHYWPFITEARRNGAKVDVAALIDTYYAEVQKMGGSRWDTSSLIARLNKK